MSVYREGYRATQVIQDAQVRIFSDAADYGAPTRKNDHIWMTAKQLVEDYGVKGTRKFNDYSVGKSVSCEVELIDEWAVSDERKTIEQARDKFIISFVTSKEGRCKGKDGYITIEKLHNV